MYTGKKENVKWERSKGEMRKRLLTTTKNGEEKKEKWSGGR